MKKALIILAILFVAVPASAASVAPVYVTVNTDVDVSAEQLSSVAPKSCARVMICNGGGGSTAVGGISTVRFKQSLTALSGTIGGVATTGFPLFPVDTSGPTCQTILPETSITTGKKIPIDATKFYVAAAGYNEAVALTCWRNDAN